MSGGLDSTLAVKMMLEQGVEVTALNFVTPFCNCNRHGRCESKQVADRFGFPLKIISGAEDYLKVIRHPRYGYGKNMNPCLDCRIFMYKKAREYMDEIGAAFVFTGEVLGQRPMSQRMDAMNLVERESGLSGRMLRPLSAKLFSRTSMEEEEIVDRERLGSIQGRSRKEQMSMARDFGIVDYACPAGGCLLTDKAFAGRLRDLFNHQKEVKVPDVLLLKVGRHFRAAPGVKIVVGRNEMENKRIEQLSRERDIRFTVKDIPGPLTLIRGEGIDDTLKVLAAGISARYSDFEGDGEVEVEYADFSGKLQEVLSVSIPDETILKKIIL